MTEDLCPKCGRGLEFHRVTIRDDTWNPKKEIRADIIKCPSCGWEEGE